MTKRKPRPPTTTELRQRILDGAGVRVEPGNKHLHVPADMPDTWHKPPKLKMLEYKYKVRIEDYLWRYSLSMIVKLLGDDVDKSTVSRWRAAAEEVAHEDSTTV